MQQNPSKFQEKLTEASKMMKKDIVQGMKLYNQAFNIYYSQKYNGRFEFFIAKIDYCDQLKDSSSYYNKARKTLEWILEKNQEEITHKGKNKRIKYLATHTLAKLYLACSQRLDIEEHYESYRQNMNLSFKNFKDAFNQILQYFITNKQGVQANNWCAQQLINIKSSYLEFIFNEAQNFKDKRHLKLVLDQVQKSFQLLKQIKTQKGQIHYYRCLYYKSMALKMMSRFSESYNVLLDDYKFQLTHDQVDHAKKSRNQLFQLCLNLNYMSQAFKYIDNSSQQSNRGSRQKIRNIMIRRQAIKNHFIQGEQILVKCDKYTYKSLFKDFDESNQIQYYHDLVFMNRSIQKILRFYGSKPQVKKLLLYYLAKSHYKLQKNKEAEKYIKEAKSFPHSDEIEMFNQKILEFMIKINNIHDKTVVQRAYNNIREEILARLGQQTSSRKRECLQNQQKNLFDAYKQHLACQRQQSDKVSYRMQNSKQNQLFELLRHTNRKIKTKA